MTSRILIDGKYLVADPGPTGEVADKNGLQTVEVPVNFPTFQEAFAMDAGRVASQVGVPSGLMLIGSPFERSQSLEVLVKYKFQGVPVSWTPENGKDRATYSLTGTEGESPMELHPRFGRLKAIFGWHADDITLGANSPGRFDYFLPNTTTPSKAYGTQGWITTGAEFQMTYVTRGVPASIFNNVGKVFNYLPEFLKAFGWGAFFDGRNWLVLAPKVEKNLGSAARVTERFRLSGPGGVNQEIYTYSGT